MKKILIMMLGVLSFGLILPLTVNAACTITGEVVRVYDNAGQTTAYIQTTPLSTAYYVVGSVDIDLRNALRNCENSRHRCAVNGSVSTCPAAVAGANLGVANYVIANP
jgi:hypothetical protein